jgi:hypothetical protein
MNAPGPKREVAKLTITLLSDGEVLVNGPLSDKMQCFGMMECAKDAIRDWNDREAKTTADTPVISSVPVNGSPR